ncbi:MAG: polyprenyl synthetase family protein [Bacteroides sp.]|nr:polyprenyl synthetase family protein [Bacteroides sp.]
MSIIDTIKAPIDREFSLFRQSFNDALTSDNPLLDEVVSYVKQQTGKMMRPVLSLLVSKSFGEVTKEVIHSSVALEMLHTASLVHDDVVDESDERRGQKSVNAAFGNKVAVLVGDYMFSTSVQQASLTDNCEIIHVISSLGRDLADGELLQLSNVMNDEFSEDVYFNIIRKKTAALFAACTHTSAIASGASGSDVERMRLLGEYIGICFQIKDDIFDYYESPKVGKPTGNDMQEGKLTLPVLYLLNNTTDPAIKEIGLKVKHKNASKQEIATLVEATKVNGGVGYAEKVMHQYVEKALEIINTIKDEEVRKSILAYVDYVVKRDK